MDFCLNNNFPKIWFIIQLITNLQKNGWLSGSRCFFSTKKIPCQRPTRFFLKAWNSSRPTCVDAQIFVTRLPQGGLRLGRKFGVETVVGSFFFVVASDLRFQISTKIQFHRVFFQPRNTPLGDLCMWNGQPGWYINDLCLHFSGSWLGKPSRGYRGYRVLLGVGQIIVTSHELTPNGGLVGEIPLFQGNLGWWCIIIWPYIYIYTTEWLQSWLCFCCVVWVTWLLHLFCDDLWWYNGWGGDNDAMMLLCFLVMIYIYISIDVAWYI